MNQHIRMDFESQAWDPTNNSRMECPPQDPQVSSEVGEMSTSGTAGKRPDCTTGSTASCQRCSVTQASTWQRTQCPKQFRRAWKTSHAPSCTCAKRNIELGNPVKAMVARTMLVARTSLDLDTFAASRGFAPRRLWREAPRLTGASSAKERLP